VKLVASFSTCIGHPDLSSSCNVLSNIVLALDMPKDECSALFAGDKLTAAKESPQMTCKDIADVDAKCCRSEDSEPRTCAVSSI
jgi:hypothetical protein